MDEREKSSSKLLKFIGVVLTIIMIICETAEFLAIPALSVLVGIINGFGYLYYVISISIYLLLFAILELISRFIFKALDKKYTPLLEKIFNRITGLFEKND